MTTQLIHDHSSQVGNTPPIPDSKDYREGRTVSRDTLRQHDVLRHPDGTDAFFRYKTRPERSMGQWHVGTSSMWIDNPLVFFTQLIAILLLAPAGYQRPHHPKEAWTTQVIHDHSSHVRNTPPIPDSKDYRQGRPVSATHSVNMTYFGTLAEQMHYSSTKQGLNVL